MSDRDTGDGRLIDALEFVQANDEFTLLHDPNEEHAWIQSTISVPIRR